MVDPLSPFFYSLTCFHLFSCFPNNQHFWLLLFFLDFWLLFVDSQISKTFSCWMLGLSVFNKEKSAISRNSRNIIEKIFAKLLPPFLKPSSPFKNTLKKTSNHFKNPYQTLKNPSINFFKKTFSNLFKIPFPPFVKPPPPFFLIFTNHYKSLLPPSLLI